MRSNENVRRVDFLHKHIERKIKLDWYIAWQEKFIRVLVLILANFI